MLNQSVMIPLLFLALVACGEGPGFDDPPKNNDQGAYKDAGPWETVQWQAGSGADYTIFSPARPGQNHGIMIWGGGTAFTPPVYEEYLDHLASHGIVVVAANTGMAAVGNVMEEGLEWALAANNDPRNRLYKKLNPAAIAVSGHSQGGSAAAALAARDDRVKTTVFVASTNLTAIHGSVFYFVGSEDEFDPGGEGIREAFDAGDNRAAYGVIKGYGHFNITGDLGYARSYATAWLLMELQGDQAAKAEFSGPDCGICTDSNWTNYASRGL